MAGSDFKGVSSLSDLAVHLSEHPEDFTKVGPETKQQLAKSYPTLTKSLGASDPGGATLGRRLFPSLEETARADLPIAGGILGGAALSELGPVGSVGGAGLGYGGGEALVNSLFGPKRSATEQLKAAAPAVITGAENEMGGQIINAGLQTVLGGITRATEAVRERLPSYGAAGVTTTTLGQATGSPGIQKIEKVPLKFLFGGRATAQVYEQQAQEAADFLTGITKGKGAQDAAQTGEALRFPMRLAARQYLHAAAEPLRQAEAMIPEGTPVKMPALNSAVQMVVDQTPLRPMTITGRLEDTLGGGLVQGSTQLGGKTYSAKFLEQFGHQMDPKVVDAMQRGMRGGEVSFQDARAIESELGDLARRQQGMGDRPDRMLKMLHQAAKQDVNAFAKSDQAPPGFQKMLEEGRMTYAKANQFLDRGVNQRLRSGDPATLADGMFSPHQDPETLQFYRKNLPEKTYNQALTVWLGSMFQASKAGTENFIPEKFAAKLAPYIESGAIDHMMAPETADTLKNVYTRYREMPGLPKETTGFMGMLEPVRIPLAAFSLLRGSMGGVSGAGAMIGGPLAIAKITTSPKVVDMLMQGIPSRAVSDNALRAAAQIIGGSIQRDDRADKAAPVTMSGRSPITLARPANDGSE